MLAITIVALVLLVFAALVIIWMAQGARRDARQISDDARQISDLHAALDTAILRHSELVVAGQDVFALLPASSDAWFNPPPGEQINFAQRQDIMRRVQDRNDKLRRFRNMLGISVAEEVRMTVPGAEGMSGAEQLKHLKRMDDRPSKNA